MTTLRFSEDELMRSHDYASPQVENGQRLHGGFDTNGTYIPPRFVRRGPAIDAWTDALRARGGDLLAADASLLGGLRYPNEAQMKLMLQEGLGQTFWNTLTITGHIEARGRILAEMTFPDFQDVIEEDISEMAIGHLNGGLLVAHGLDEGGEPARGIGGHDVMWFVLRDLAFGEVDYPEPEVPENIARPEGDLVLPPEIPEGHARLLSFLLNLLLIEFRAELGFSMTESLLRDPELFTERRDEANHAAEIVERIRRDEEVHVSSLRLFLGELRSIHFKGRRGAGVPGHELVDPIWEGIVRWATVDQPKLAAEQQKKLLSDRILAHPEGERILARFHALEEAA
ncbi:MAG: hypothetical protein JRH01_01975 [Deltaproteobacteria bacterium]|nr:hypothetical protein [Deltaproteobacteria bacterium]MBW2393524.1 hypothetical protein [Deltaproteobacteria bacterium]